MKESVSHRIEFRNGEVCVLDSRDLKISGHPDAERAECASLYYRAAHYLGVAQIELEQADNRYRNWRGEESSTITGADHKVKAAVDSRSAFLEHKDRLARLQANVSLLEGFMKAVEIKSRMLSAQQRELNSPALKQPSQSVSDDEIRRRRLFTRKAPEGRSPQDEG